MDSLTPDKDDLERFRQDRSKAAPAKADVGPAVAPGGTRAAASRPGTAKSGAGGSAGNSAVWLTTLVLLLVIAVAVVSFWQIFRQQATIDQLQQELTEASQYINQSKLVTARLEGSLNETEANVAQSGSQLVSRLNTMDSEIRKLWDVANKRNSEQIKAAQAKIAALESANEKLQARVQAAEQEVAAVTRGGKEQQARIEALAKNDEVLQTKLAQVEQAGIARTEGLARADALARVESLAKNNQAQLTAVVNRVEAAVDQGAGQKVDGRLQNVETAIDSIDANRQQLNRRVIDLERRLNEAQLRLNAIQGPAVGG